MKIKLMPALLMASMLFLFSCDSRDKVKNMPNPSGSHAGKHTPLNLTLTPGQKHNLVLERYFDQYGFVADNQITVAEAEIIADRIAGIMEDEDLLVDITATELSEQIMEICVNSGSFVNGVLRPSNEVITMSINQVTNIDLKNAYTQIYNLATVGGPNFVPNANTVLNNLSGLNQNEQNEVNGFQSIMGSSNTLWSNPVYLPTPGPNRIAEVANADASGYREGHSLGLQLGADESFSEFMGTGQSIMRSALARIGN